MKRLMILMITFAFISRCEDAHRDFLVKYYEKDSWHKRQPEERISLETVFFDLNDDGRDEALIADWLSRDRSGNCWRVAFLNDNGEIGSIGMPGPGETNTLLQCHASDLFIAASEPKKVCMVGQNVLLTSIGNDGSPNGFQADYRATVLLSMRTNGFLVATTLRNGLDELVRSSKFKRLEHVIPEWFYGVNLVPRKSTVTHFPNTVEADSTITNDICTSASFATVLTQYRKQRETFCLNNGKLTVFVILLDADNDGDADLYVSSDAEKAGGSMYRWHLYLNDNGSFAKAKERVWFNRKGPGALVEILEPEEVAAKDAFHRVLLQKPFEPTVVILDAEDGRLHSHTVKNPLIAGDMKKRPVPKSNDDREGWDAREEWADSFWKKHGFPPPFDFGELVADPWFFALERLPCREFAE